MLFSLNDDNRRFCFVFEFGLILMRLKRKNVQFLESPIFNCQLLMMANGHNYKKGVRKFPYTVISIHFLSELDELIWNTFSFRDYQLIQLKIVFHFIFYHLLKLKLYE